jgi:hypothetical protein
LLFSSKNSKNKAKKELAQNILTIPPEIRDWVLWRYLRFCQDQHAFTFLSYRKKLKAMNFDKAHLLGIKIRLGMRKKNHYHLRHCITDVLVLDPK